MSSVIRRYIKARLLSDGVKGFVWYQVAGVELNVEEVMGDI
ncbi:MAG: hypothetical protein ABIU63_16205 [Chitinophagaceae bacterium]